MAWFGVVVVMWGLEWWSRGERGRFHTVFFNGFGVATLQKETFLGYLNDVIQFMLFSPLHLWAGAALSLPVVGWWCFLASCVLDGGAFPSAVFGWWCCSPYFSVVVFSPLLHLVGGVFPSLSLSPLTWCCFLPSPLPSGWWHSFPSPSLRGAVSLLLSLTWCNTCCSINLCHWVGTDVFKSSPQGGGVKHHHPKEE